MNKKRLIQIKTSKLRKIRNNYRGVIIAACSWQQTKAMESDSVDSNDDWWSIERPLRASICVCPSCFNSKSDMVYNPVLEKLFCSKCYELNKKFKTSRLYP